MRVGEGRQVAPVLDRLGRLAMRGQASSALLRVTMIWLVEEYQYSGPSSASAYRRR